jgi:hypothetical protein
MQNHGMIEQEETTVNADPLNYDDAYPPVPPSYEQCVAPATGPQADYVVSPLAMAALFDWDEDDE